MNTTSEKKGLLTKEWAQSTLGIILVVLAVVGFLFWKSIANTISIEKSQISAPVISLSPQSGGTLDQVYVHEGDDVLPNTPLARVGTETISSGIHGIVVSVDRELGKNIAPGQAVVSLINPAELRVVGQIDENKGLADVRVGQPASFTVDAFGSTKYSGIVEKISPTSSQSGVAFSISDKREIKQFDVSVRYNVVDHPEFKNGMSARITIYK